MIFKRFLSLLKNKYAIVATIFLIWMIFFDQNDFISQYDYSAQISKMEKEKDFYLKNNLIIDRNLKELSTDISTAEKFAREKYFMKRNNEDVFIIVAVDSSKTSSTSTRQTRLSTLMD